MKTQLDQLKLSKGETFALLEDERNKANDESKELRNKISAMERELSYEHEKLSNLQHAMDNLTAGKEELIARERAAAEERAEQQRIREKQYADQIANIENIAKERELRLRSELNQTKNESIRKEKEQTDSFETMKRTKDKEIDALRR